ncbi:HAUS1 protein, partial [Heliornis fulica]|nr:HAUS1 protein [Heliornis fulica]
QINLWLNKIFEKQPVPEYEVNEKSVDTLYELLEVTEARDRDVSLLIEDMKEKETEYCEAANYIKDILKESLGLSTDSLSSEGTGYLNFLAESAVLLETKDTSLPSFFSAINDMTSELYATELRNREMAEELDILNKKLLSAMKLEKQLNTDVKEEELFLENKKHKVDSQCERLSFLNEKSVNLEMEVGIAQEELVARGWDQSLTHQSLVNLS